MAENLRRRLFALPPLYGDSLRAITPGLKVLEEKVKNALVNHASLLWPILRHCDGPKFHLELNVSQPLSLLNIFEDQHTFKETFNEIYAVQA